MQNIKAELALWWKSLVDLFFPRRCCVCGRALQQEEEVLCLECNMGMPRTNFHLWKENPVEKLFWGKFTLGRATSYFYYHKGSDYRNLILPLKYNGRSDLGEALGRMVAADLSRHGFFQGIDLLLPVPLHPLKAKQRGYNQSECVAKGISLITGIPIDTSSVIRIKQTETQTHKSAKERWENVKEIFETTVPERLKNKHILLIDDVLTTTATVTACADAIQTADGVCISVLTLAVAGMD